MEIKVLDKGFVRLVDSMGDDSRVVQAARVSYGSGTKTPEQDAKLIRYLMKHQHTSPFEKVRFEFHIKAPLFVTRQIVRHRMVSWNEQSARYSEMPDEFYIPKLCEIKGQGKSNKQGSEGEISEEAKVEFREDVVSISHTAYAYYKDALANGVSREDARMLLPVNIYTQWYWGIDLHNLFHFLKLRNDWHAQHQTQEYAQAIEVIAQTIVPECFKVWKEINFDNN